MRAPRQRPTILDAPALGLACLATNRRGARRHWMRWMRWPPCLPCLPAGKVTGLGEHAVQAGTRHGAQTVADKQAGKWVGRPDDRRVRRDEMMACGWRRCGLVLDEHCQASRQTLSRVGGESGVGTDGIADGASWREERRIGTTGIWSWHAFL
jgi:hypothetical protein